MSFQFHSVIKILSIPHFIEQPKAAALEFLTKFSFSQLSPHKKCVKWKKDCKQSFSLYALFALLNVMRKMGLEPTRCNHHKILSLARLPVPTLPLTDKLRSPSEYYNIIWKTDCQWLFCKICSNFLHNSSSYNNSTLSSSCIEYLLRIVLIYKILYWRV